MNERKDDCAHVTKNQDAMKTCNDGRVLRNHLLATSHAQNFDKTFGCLRTSNGIAINENKSIPKLSPFLQPFQVQSLKTLGFCKGGNSLEQIFNKESHINADSDTCKQGQILKKARAVTFGGLCWALCHQLRAIDTAHKSVLAISWQSCGHSLDVCRNTERIDLMCHLDDARSGITCLFDRDFAF